MSDDLFQVLYGDRPQLQDNCCNYDLYLNNCTKEEGLSLVDEIEKVIFADHLWQWEPFKISHAEYHPRKSSVHLCGKTKFGDNIDDEWFIVYALLQITKELKGCVAQISDNDGQFLLIEAADSLPSWLSPSNSQNRVFLYGGSVHLISQDVDQSKFLDIQAALKYVRDDKINTCASEPVCNAIAARTLVFPQLAVKNRHRCHCYVPKNVADLLSCHTRQIAADATRAFYLRSSEDAAACATMQTFLPSLESRVAVCVTLTRCLYAQLSQQEFHAPKPFKKFMEVESENDAQAADLGMRLTCGFEILARKERLCNSPKHGKCVAEGVCTCTCSLKQDYPKLCAEINTPEDKIDWLHSSLQLEKRMDMYKDCPDTASVCKSPTQDDVGSVDSNLTISKATNLVNEMKLFMNSSSGYDGVESTANLKSAISMEETTSATSESGVQIDLDKFMNILGYEEKGCFEKATCLQDGEDDDNHTDGDSDEELLNKAFDEVMECELASSSLASTFVTTENVTETKSEGTSPYRGLKPLDIDVNLISSMLSSFSAQEGLPGPVSNILGDLGLDPQLQ